MLSCNTYDLQEGQFEDTYVEIIGLVQDVNEIKLQGIINLGSNLGSSPLFPFLHLIQFHFGLSLTCN